MDSITLGERIRAIREARGMSQEELSNAAGLGIKYISVIERGVKQPKLSTLLKIIAALGATPNDLLLDQEPTTPFMVAFNHKLAQLSEEKQEQLLTIVDTLVDKL